jgi:acetoin utilization deacetylase AcuC-like enzyme
VSMLEGGYTLSGLASAATAHVAALCGAPSRGRAG